MRIDRTGRTTTRWRGVALAWLALVLAAGNGRAAVTPTPDFTRLDPRLLNAALAAPDDTVAVWVQFADKGEQGPADLAARLAAAAAALDPHARARRERAHVWPLVDALDLPVHAPYLAALRARGFAPYGVSRWFNQAALHVPGARLAELTRLPFVRLVMPVARARLTLEPVGEAVEGSPAPRVTPLSATQTTAYAYGQSIGPIKQMNLPAVHDSGYIGTGVRICMLDDGFNWYRTHQALKTIAIVPGGTRDFVDGDTDPTDTTNTGQRHGSATLGCAGANKPGVYLGAGFGASFMLGRTEYDPTEKPIEMVNWGMGAEWADSMGADIISSSLGYTTFPDSAGQDYHYSDMNGHTTIVSRAAEIAAAKGILVVNSAGNDGNNQWHFIGAPADVDGDSLIAAAAVDTFGVVTSFSSRGPTYDGRLKPDLAARGTNVPVVSVGADHVAGYGFSAGTSFSCPLLAGMCACILQARPQWSPRMVIAALKMTASRAANPDTLTGWGVPNALEALRLASVDTPAVPRTHGRPTLALASANPARGDGDIVFRITDAGGPARLRVLDMQGRVVRTLDVCCDAAVVRWDGHASHGGPLRAGLYFVQLEAATSRPAVRLVVIR